MSVILWSCDRQLRLTSVSGPGLSAKTIEANRFIGTAAAVILEEFGLDQSEVLQRLRGGLEGRASDLLLHIWGKDIELHIEPVRESDREVSGLVGVILDVTERNRAASALRESEERYRMFLERSSEGICRWELKEPWPKGKTIDEQVGHMVKHGYVAECNDAMARLYGFATAHELIGQRLADVRRPGSNTRVDDVGRAFVASGFQPRQYELNWVDEHGVSRWSANTVVGIVEDGALIRTWATQRDITQRKQAEMNLEKALSEIHAASRLLEIKNAELERFTYTVSHDLRSPLITIRGYLGHLERSALEGDLERFREDAGRIDRAANKMEALLRDLLALSRVGRVLKPDEDVSMNEVVQDAADLVRGPLIERRVTLHIEDQLPMVRGDRQRLAEVVQNLIENAVKFMGDQGDARIRIGTRGEPSGTVLFVSDNGIGIDPRHQEKIFDLFEQLSPGADGTGVGLALVKRIVEAHGGRVWVESEGLGRGSTFCFTLRARS